MRDAPLVAELEEYPLRWLVVAVCNVGQVVDDDEFLATARAGDFESDLRKLGPPCCDPPVGKLHERTDEAGRCIVDIDFKLQRTRVFRRRRAVRYREHGCQSQRE